MFTTEDECFNLSVTFCPLLIFLSLSLSLSLSVQVLNVSAELSTGIFRILSAILWIGNLEFQDSESEACQLTEQDLQVVRKVARLLGISETQVRKVCTIRQISVKGTTTDIALKYHEVGGREGGSDGGR